VANESRVSDTQTHTFIDMYPIFPTVDLKDENVYDLERPHVTGMQPGQSHIHTFIHLNDDEFNNEHDLSRLLMFAFGTAYAQSKIQVVF
jgi:hypothetical protein